MGASAPGLVASKTVRSRVKGGGEERTLDVLLLLLGLEPGAGGSSRNLISMFNHVGRLGGLHLSHPELTRSEKKADEESSNLLLVLLELGNLLGLLVEVGQFELEVIEDLGRDHPLFAVPHLG